MSKLLSTILKFLLILLLAALIVLAGYWLHIRFEWTPLMLGGLFAGILAFFLLIFLVRRIYYRKREESFIRSMVDHSAPTLKLQEEQNSLDELRKKWSKSLGILQRSRLRLSGNPIYSLPWFMVFGESGAGKSTSISHARLSATASQAGPLAHVPNTRNCDWWFFEEAVILDTAGRYAVPLSPEADEREWEELLHLIASTRKREPLNGLVLALPAEKLLQDNESALGDYGRHIRMRLESMARILGAMVPIYIMVTKVDHVLGMTEFSLQLSEQERTQALGLLNKETSGSALDFLEKTFSHVQARLRDMSMVFAARRGSQNGPAALFPEEFGMLKSGLAAFTKGAFSPSPYSETPLLRGVFFSSGKQSGLIEAREFADLETFKQHPWHLPNTDSAFFLHNFFASILPKERGLTQFLDSYLSRISITRNLGYLVWLCLLFALCSYFSISFMENRTDMEHLSYSTIVPPDMTDSLQSTVIKLNGIIDTIEVYSSAIVDNWWFYPGKTQTQNVLQTLQHNYAAWMRERLFQESDSLTARTLAAQEPENRRITLAMLTEYLVWTRKAISAAAEGKDVPPPAQDITAEYFNQAGLSIPLNNQYFNRAFVTYVKWERPQFRHFIEERSRVSIQKYMAMLGDDLRWLTDWLETRRLLEPVRLSRYWPNTGSKLEISRAFTPKAVERLKAISASLEDAALNKEDFRRRLEAYKVQYAAQYRDAWWDLAEKFHQGPDRFTRAEAWRLAAANMSSLDNPYFTFIKDMSDALAAVEGIGTPDPRDFLPPLFVALTKAYSESLEAEEDESVKGKIGKATQARKESLGNLLQAEKAQQASRISSALEPFTEYMDALRKLYVASRTANEAMLLVSAGFSGEDAAGQTPIAPAQTALNLMEPTLDPQAIQNREFWNLVEGPLSFQTSLAIYRASCNLNQLWRDNVLAYALRYSPEHRWEVMFGEHGYVTDFLHGPAKPFLYTSRGHWLADDWLGYTFPLTDDFLTFLDLGDVEYTPPQPEYSVHLSTLPTNVNPTAEKPYRVRLTLNCGQDLQQLNNLNYPDGKTFTWKYEKCGDTTLEIFFEPSIVLKKVWPGAMGFRSFLSSFHGTTLRLIPEDFHSHTQLLQEMGIEYIDVRYQFDGIEDILDISSHPVLPRIPADVAMCRDDISIGGAGDSLNPTSIPLNLPEAQPEPDAKPKAVPASQPQKQNGRGQ